MSAGITRADNWYICRCACPSAIISGTRLSQTIKTDSNQNPRQLLCDQMATSAHLRSCTEEFFDWLFSKLLPPTHPRKLIRRGYFDAGCQWTLGLIGLDRLFLGDGYATDSSSLRAVIKASPLTLPMSCEPSAIPQ